MRDNELKLTSSAVVLAGLLLAVSGTSRAENTQETPEFWLESGKTGIIAAEKLNPK